MEAGSKVLIRSTDFVQLFCPTKTNAVVRYVVISGLLSGSNRAILSKGDMPVGAHLEMFR